MLLALQGALGFTDFRYPYNIHPSIHPSNIHFLLIVQKTADGGKIRQKVKSTNLSGIKNLSNNGFKNFKN